MAASRATFRQDMPPKGGYEPVNFARVPSKSYLSGSKMFVGVAALQAGGIFLYYLTVKMLRREKLENNDAKLALEPMLWAERDREYLKQIRRNRDEEEKLMKNVPGWETGTLFGEPVYKTVDKNDWVDPILHEYYSQTHEKHLLERLGVQLWQ